VFPLSAPRLEVDVQRHAALLEMADAVCFRRHPAELFRDIAPQLRTTVPFDFVNFALFDSARRTMKMFLWEGVDWPREPLEIGVEEAATGSVWRNQTLLSINDLSTEKRFEPELRWLREREMRSYCVLPLTTVREKLGGVGFGSKQAHAFNAHDAEFLNRVVEMVALCVDPALDETTVGEEKARLRLLLEVGSPRIRASDLPQSLASILGSMQRWAVRDFVGVYLYDHVSQALRLHTADPQLTERMAPRGLTPLDGTLAGHAFRSRRSISLDHADLAASPFASVQRGLELGVRSIYLAPIPSRNGPLGVLKVARRADHRFSPRDVELLERVAAAVGPAFERSAAEGEPQFKADPVWPILDFSKLVASTIAVTNTGYAILSDLEQLSIAYFSASKVGLCIVDTDSRFLAINNTLAEMNGIPAAAHLGKTVREVLGDLAELVEPQFERVLATRQAVLNLEISTMLATRTEPGHWMEHFIPIKDAMGNVTQIGAVVVEITDQKKLEESLRGVSETLREEKKRQHVLSEVSRALAAKWDVREGFPKISAYLRRILRQEYAALVLHDEKSGLLIRQAIDFPLRKKAPGDADTNAAKDPGVKAFRERESLIFTRDDLQGFPSGTTEHLLAEGLKSLCCLPLLRPKGPMGVLVLGSTRADAFKTDDLMLLNQVAAQLAIALENARTAREVKELRSRLDQEKGYLEGEARAQLHFEEIVGESPALQEVLKSGRVVATSDATVLLLGETGTGKGLIARAIHRLSKRKDRGFITLNCAAIPTGLLESELFGHEKGAFTGAVNQKIGRLELADKGTVFLDEIGEIPLELQPKLLRVLQDHEFERLGGTRTIKVDLRLIAATNRDLARSVAEKEFRSDLFYRLNVFPIRMPSLRERREDIPLLVRYFVQKFARGMARTIETIPSEAMQALTNWDWPGNVRELENFIERSVILTDGTALRAPLVELQMESSDSPEDSLEGTERELIIRVLRETDGTISGTTGAAHRLGLKRTTLQSKIQRLGITRRDFAGQRPS
jgi:formate hydrogenlyase transcriptional activator